MITVNLFTTHLILMTSNAHCQGRLSYSQYRRGRLTSPLSLALYVNSDDEACTPS